MAKHQDKDQKVPPTTPEPTGNTGKDSIKRPDPVNDDTYDPVGMAGKKAGIVVQIEQQAAEEEADESKPPNDVSAADPKKEKA